MSRVSGFAAVFILPALLWQLAFFLLPLLFLVVLTFWSVRNFALVPDLTLANWAKVLGLPYFWGSLGTSLSFAFGVAFLAGALAFPVSRTIALKFSARARRLALAALLAPFFTSYLVRIYSWQAHLGDPGLVNGLLGQFGVGPFLILNSAAGSVVGYLTLCLPLVVILQTIGLAGIDRELVAASQNLGCRPLRAIFVVEIPAAKAGLIVAWLFAFILVFGDFASPIYLGGATSQTMSILVTDLTKAGQQWPRAAVAAVVMVATLLATAFAALRIAYRET